MLLMPQWRRRAERGFVVLALLLGGQLVALRYSPSAGATACAPGPNHCYGVNRWSGQPGTFSGGAASIYIPVMTYNDPGGVLTNEMWIANTASGQSWVEAGAYVGHAFAGARQGEQIYFAAQLNTAGEWIDYRFAAVPSGDTNQWANVYIFNSAPGQ